MRGQAILLGSLLLGLALPLFPARAASLQDDFVETLTRLDDAKRLQRAGDAPAALLEYEECELELKKVHGIHPDWEPALVQARLAECRVQIDALQVDPKAQPEEPLPPQTLEQDYLAVFLALNNAKRVEQMGDAASALDEYRRCYNMLQKIRGTNPDFERLVMTSRLEDCAARIEQLQRVVKTASAPTATQDFPLPPPHETPATLYPWKTDIVTKVFSIGGKSTPPDPWDPDWVDENGGADGWESMSGYASAGHASQMNPFYVALPFDDLAYPVKARRWVPPGWQKPPRDGKPVSACQGRWVEIKADNGRDCFAQWEDVGPNRDDHAEYVFGSERPDTGNRAGLAVSPAVAKYMGITPQGADHISWRFVENADVRPGLWLKYDEQAIIFRALHQQEEGKNLTPSVTPTPTPTPTPAPRPEPRPAPAQPAIKKSAPAQPSTGDLP